MNWYTIKSKLLSFFSDIRIYPGGIIVAGDSHYEVKGPDMRAVLDNIKAGDILLRRYSHYLGSVLIQAGDILLRRYSHYLGSVLIQGHFSHAAIYVGDNNVIHMLGEGINKEDILTFMRCDDICILRSDDVKITNTAISKAHGFYAMGIEYDYNFDTDSPDKFYCTEFVDNCFGYMVKNSKSEDSHILPDDFLHVPQLNLVWRKK